MKSLNGLRVALLEARMTDELAALVRRYGGEPYAVPAVREVTCDAAGELAALLDELRGTEAPLIVLSTGVGVTALFREADRLGRKEELRQLLRRGTTVCRGPKPAGALAREGVPVALKAQEPYTTAEVLQALEGQPLQERTAVLVHYGERNLPLLEALAGRGLRVRELLLYEWRLPEDTGPLEALVGEVADGRVRAIAFTSQIQARHLFQIAERMGRRDALLAGLRRHATIAAVGPTCAHALEELGVRPHVVPEHPKMGPMIAGLVEHLHAREAPKA